MTENIEYINEDGSILEIDVSKGSKVPGVKHTIPKAKETKVPGVNSSRSNPPVKNINSTIKKALEMMIPAIEEEIRKGRSRRLLPAEMRSNEEYRQLLASKKYIPPKERIKKPRIKKEQVIGDKGPREVPKNLKDSLEKGIGRTIAGGALGAGVGTLTGLNPLATGAAGAGAGYLTGGDKEEKALPSKKVKKGVGGMALASQALRDPKATGEGIREAGKGIKSAAEGISSLKSSVLKKTDPILSTAKPKVDKELLKAKSQASLRIKKAISVLEGYEPMNDTIVMKSFGGEIPNIMKEVELRPPETWWNDAVQKASQFEDYPAKYSMELWYNIQKANLEESDEEDKIINDSANRDVDEIINQEVKKKENINKAVAASSSDEVLQPKKRGENKALSDGSKVDVSDISGPGKSEQESSY